MILCSDKSLYTGITNNIERRMDQHVNNCGAKYFRGRVPGHLVYLEGGHDRSSASKREREIKKMKCENKHCLLGLDINEIEKKIKLGRSRNV